MFCKYNFGPAVLQRISSCLKRKSIIGKKVDRYKSDQIPFFTMERCINKEYPKVNSGREKCLILCLHYSMFPAPC
jgi:hypothetical protein